MYDVYKQTVTFPRQSSNQSYGLFKYNYFRGKKPRSQRLFNIFLDSENIGLIFSFLIPTKLTPFAQKPH